MLSVSFAIAFTVYIYTPLDMYLHNPGDFIVSYKFFLPVLLMLFVLLFILLVLFLLFIWRGKIIESILLSASGIILLLAARFAFSMFSIIIWYLLVGIITVTVLWILMLKLFKKAAVDIIVLLMWGAVIAAYVQTLFLNGNMILISAISNKYNAITINNILNILIWAVIIITPPYLFILLKKKNKSFEYGKVLVFSVIIISGMQIAGLVSTAYFTDLPKGYEESAALYKSYKPTSRFHKDNNIIVFVIDRVDVLYMNEALEEYPHIYDLADGFTFYENSTAEYWDTFPAMPSMLTHYYYENNQPMDEYFDEAWGVRNFIDTLKDNGFTTNLYLDYASTYGSYAQIVDRADNLITHDKVERSTRGIFSVISRLSLGRLSPYFAKNIWLTYIYPTFGNSFLIYPEFVQRLGIGTQSDMEFYSFILQSDFNAESIKNVFTLLHLNGAHGYGDRNDPSSRGMHYDEESKTINTGGSHVDSIRASFEIINVYFTKMKELGVYDNSTIIVMADHGARQTAGVTSSLLIKPPGSTGRMQRNSETQMSHRYFAASILDAAGLPYDEFGISYFDLINAAPSQTRVLYATENWFEPWAFIGAAASLHVYGHYEFTGDANDAENWSFIDLLP